MAWERLASVAGSGGTTLSSGTFSAKKNLRIIAYLKDSGSGGNIAQLRFNGDSGSNYATRASRDGGSDTDWGSINRFISYHNSTLLSDYLVIDITNISGEEKLVIGHNTGVTATGAGTAPVRQEWVGKWVNTSAQITSLEFTSNGSGFTSDSYITVLAAKEAGTADTMTVSGFTAKKHLKAQMFAEGTGGTINCNFTFNNDTGGNYAIRESVNDGTDSTNVNISSSDNLTGTVTGNIFADVHILNEASKEKLFISEGMENASGASNTPDRKEIVGKWTNTSDQITTIKANNSGAGSYKEGSELIVWGSDGDADTTYPTLVGVYIFEETDTGKHYIFDGSSTWTEVA